MSSFLLCRIEILQNFMKIMSQLTCSNDIGIYVLDAGDYKN